MRQAHREYAFDWMLYSAFSAAARLNDGSAKEYRYAVEKVPYFRGILDAVFSAGEPGRIFLRLAATYFESVVRAHERGQRAAITTFCFSPTILYAFDVVPVCLEVLSAMLGLASINSRMPMVKSIRGPYDARHMWLEDSLALAKLQSADFMVYNGTPGCRNTWGMVKLFVRDTEKAGFPTHVINSDSFDERVQSWPATRERFEEFLSVRRLLR